MVSWSVNFRRVFFIVAPNKLRRCTERIGRMHGTYSKKKGCTEVQPLRDYFLEMGLFYTPFTCSTIGIRAIHNHSTAIFQTTLSSK